MTAKRNEAESLLRLSCRWKGCNQAFAQAADARNHELQVHFSDSENTECLIEGCGKGFDKHAKLARHSLAHQERQHKCDVCGKLFSYSWDLKRHKYIHGGTRPYRCHFQGCDRSFTKSKDLSKHLNQDHRMNQEEIRRRIEAVETEFVVKAKARSKKKKSKDTKPKRNELKRTQEDSAVSPTTPKLLKSHVEKASHVTNEGIEQEQDSEGSEHIRVEAPPTFLNSRFLEYQVDLSNTLPPVQRSVPTPISVSQHPSIVQIPIGGVQYVNQLLHMPVSAATGSRSIAQQFVAQENYHVTTSNAYANMSVPFPGGFPTQVQHQVAPPPGIYFSDQSSNQVFHVSAQPFPQLSGHPGQRHVAIPGQFLQSVSSAPGYVFANPSLPMQLPIYHHDLSTGGHYPSPGFKQ